MEKSRKAWVEKVQKKNVAFIAFGLAFAVLLLFIIPNRAYAGFSACPSPFSADTLPANCVRGVTVNNASGITLLNNTMLSQGTRIALNLTINISHPILYNVTPINVTVFNGLNGAVINSSLFNLSHQTTGNPPITFLGNISATTIIYLGLQAGNITELNISAGINWTGLLVNGTAEYGWGIHMNMNPHIRQVLKSAETVTRGKTIVFTVDWSDRNQTTLAEQVRMYACDTDSASPAGGCTGTMLCNATWTNSTPTSCTHTIPTTKVAGAKKAYIFLTDYLHSPTQSGNFSNGTSFALTYNVASNVDDSLEGAIEYLGSNPQGQALAIATAEQTGVLSGFKTQLFSKNAAGETRILGMPVIVVIILLGVIGTMFYKRRKS